MYHDLFDLNKASRWQRFTKLLFPHCLPYLITGMKVSGGLAMVGAIVGEFFVGYAQRAKGLGFLIRQANDMNRTDLLFAAVFLSTTLGVLILLCVQLLSATLLRRWCHSD